MTTNKTTKQARSHSSNTLTRFAGRGNPMERRAVHARMMLATRIYDAMKAKGWNQKTFAAELGKQESEISKWLSGHHNFTVDTLVAIEEKLGITLLQTENKPERTTIHYRPIIISSFSNATFPQQPASGLVASNLNPVYIQVSHAKAKYA